MPALPRGMINLWYGSVATIPPGWIICDGNNGTPNLKNRFIVGAGLTYDPGDIGGGVFHNHTFTSDGHSHNIPAGAAIATGAAKDDTTSTDTDSGTTDNAGHLPPYHALVFIMRI